MLTWFRNFIIPCFFVIIQSQKFYRISSNQANMPIFYFLPQIHFSHTLLYYLFRRINGCGELHKKVLHTLEYKFVTSSKFLFFFFLIRKMLSAGLGLMEKKHCKLFTPKQKIYGKRAHLRSHFLSRYHISINYMQKNHIFFFFLSTGWLDFF